LQIFIDNALICGNL